MEHLALEIFNLNDTESKFAFLPSDTSITITRTSQIFDNGNVWSLDFKLCLPANAHIFGSVGELRGTGLHDVIEGRRARLWIVGLPWYYGNLHLASNTEIDQDGNVDITFNSGRKSFDDLIEGVSARDVSVGDVIIGVALNRKRGVRSNRYSCNFQLDSQIKALTDYGAWLKGLELNCNTGIGGVLPSVRTQKWPKLVMSRGYVKKLPSTIAIDGTEEYIDYTNVQTAYDEGHPFCNINICYQKKYRENPEDKNSEEKTARGYTVRLGYGLPTVSGGDGQTRFNNAPNFYLLYWLKRLFMDIGIEIIENQMMDVEDLRRVFLANMGCFYEEKDLDINVYNNYESDTPDWYRYGSYLFEHFNVVTTDAKIYREDDDRGSVLARNISIIREDTDEVIDTISSVPGQVTGISGNNFISADTPKGYLAYATGDNYPDVDVSDIIEATEKCFGVRFLFNDNFTQVRIVLLRNIFNNETVQVVHADIRSITKQENNIKGFKMTYGKGEEDTNYFYRGFANALNKKTNWWIDNDDKHDYTHWDLNANYDALQKDVTAFNKTCYVTPETGNAYAVKIDEDESVFFPALFEVAGYADAEDGDCTGEEDTIEEVSLNFTPLLMNNVDGTYAVLCTEDMKAPGDTEVAAQAWCETAHFDKSNNIRAYIESLGTYVYATMDVDIYLKEGYIINLQDNYSFSGDDGTPFDNADLGLQFGIMRSSGSDAMLTYLPETNDEEGNEWWKMEPGTGTIDHPDTCDSNGNLWDYNGAGDGSVTVSNVHEKLSELWPASGRNAPFSDSTLGYINGVGIVFLTDSDGVRHSTMLVTSYSTAGRTVYPLELTTYPEYLSGGTVEEMLQRDRTGMGALRNLIVEIDSSQERCNTLLQICSLAYGSRVEPIYTDNGVGSLFGRFSLKLRAEKPNPYFDPTQPESDENRRYLKITSPNLQGRGLSDQFYKEYSYWVRNARIATIEAHLEAAQLIGLDDSVKVEIGDITGFIKQMQVTIDMQSGIGVTKMDILYL